MALTPEQKEHAISLIETGEKLEVVRYFQQTLNIDAEQALVLAEKLQEEVDAEIADRFGEKFVADQPVTQPTSNLNVGKLVGGIFLTVGLIMLAVVAYLINSNYKFAQRAVKVKGKVIEYRNYQSSNDNGGSTTMYTPVFEYEFKSQSYKHTSSTSSSSPEYEIGEVVDVLVDPQNPKEILINTFWEKWFVVVLLGFMGSIFSGVGFLVYRFVGRS